MSEISLNIADNLFDKGRVTISYVEETWMDKDTAAISVEFLSTLQTI
jgi:hypothetical protein